MPDALDSWSHLVGASNDEDIDLTQLQFDSWKSDPNRKYVCSACWNEVPDSDHMFCSQCNEYRYTIPAIPGWSWANE